MSEEPDPKPKNETPEDVLARARKETGDLGAKIDAVEKEVSPKHPPVPGIGSMF